MSLERILQICMAGLAAMATLLLGMGERNAVLPLLAVIVAASSVYFVDVRNWISLNTAMANLAGLAALVASLWDYRSVQQEENQLLALANLLIYLQCVLLFRRKTPRIYWMLALLGLLQVAVATVLNMSIWFGVLLVVFMLLALATLTVFLVYREQQRFSPSYVDDISFTSTTTSAPMRTPPSRAFVPRSLASVPLTEVRRAVARQVSRMAAVTLALTCLVFLLVPRTGTGAWGERLIDPTQHMVGFSDSVTLGELGEIVENPDEVLQMRFVDAETGNPYYLREIPLLRGTVLTRYDDGQWSMDPLASANKIPSPSASQRGLIRQEFQLAHLSTPTLFAIHPLLDDGADNPRLVFDAQNDWLKRGVGKYVYPLQYTLLTSGIVSGRQLPIIPATNTPNAFEWHLRLLQEVDAERHRGLRRVAAEAVAGIDATDIVARCRALERQLRDLGGYRYSLSPPQRDTNQDPIEDFIVTNRVGHCEYFASALTLMLRSVGIPARMCVGFKGADWNPLTKSYHIRQWHAHAWVEAYLLPEQLPKDTLESTRGQIPASQWEHGGWLRLDPTPAFEGADVMPPTTLFPSLRQMLDYADYLWSGYILSMDSKRQRESIFKPLREGTSDIISVLLDRKMWRKTFSNLGRLLQGQKLDDTGLWFSWRAAVVTFVALTLIVFLYRAVSWILRRLMRIARPPELDSQGLKDAEVEFYRRLEEILSRQKLVRQPHQTQREFATHIGSMLARSPRTSHVAAIPRSVAELFYGVRFGNTHLPPSQLEFVDRSLTELADALESPSAGTGFAEAD